MANDVVIKNFLCPPEEFSPIPFWFWNDKFSEEKIKEQILDMKAHGIDGFVIHPRIGIPESIGYLSDEFMHFVKFAVKCAKDNNMKVVLYDEGMYPSGSANGKVVEANGKFANKCLVQEICPAQSSVELPKTNEDEMLVASLAIKVENDTLKDVCIINGGDTFAKDDMDSWSFAHYIMKYSGSTIRGIHFGEDDLEPNAPKAADLMNIEATKVFIECTHERYYEVLKEHFGDTIIAIFTDEPSPEARFAMKGTIPWTDDFLEHFLKELPIEALPLLWQKQDERYDSTYKKYRCVINKLMGERFFAPISLWCSEHNIALTGHPGKSNDIGHMKHFGIPCQDVVWRYVEPGNDTAITGDHSTMGKCTSDAARHRGIRRNGNEVLGCCGPADNGWLMSFSDVKWYIDWLFARGVNLIYPHAFFYSVTKPRYDERPPDVGFNSYWWDNFGAISTYIKRMCYMLTDITNVCDTAFLCGPHELPYVYPRAFFENQREFNYLEKELLETKATICDGYVNIQNQKYKNIVIENAALLSGKALDMLRQFAKDGGRVFTAFESDEFCYIDEPEKLLDFVQKEISIYPENKKLRSSVVIKDGKKFAILINEGDERIVGEIAINGAGLIDLLNPMTGEIKPFDGMLCLNPRESVILYVKSEYEVNPLNKWTVNGKDVSLTDWLTWKGYENYCGTLCYETSVELGDAKKASIHFDNVCEMVAVSVNGSKDEYIMCPPFEMDITALVKKGTNKITAKVTNSSAMRFSDARPASGIVGDVHIKIS